MPQVEQGECLTDDLASFYQEMTNILKKLQKGAKPETLIIPINDLTYFWRLHKAKTTHL